MTLMKSIENKRFYISLVLLGLILISCTSSKNKKSKKIVSPEHEIIQGYSGPILGKAKKMINGKTPEETKKILGTPAAEGLCKSCGPRGTYKMIYLTKDMRRFYLELSYNTDQDINCVVVNFYYSKDQQKYLFDAVKGFEIQRKCNRKDGAILELKEILEAGN